MHIHRTPRTPGRRAARAAVTLAAAGLTLAGTQAAVAADALPGADPVPAEVQYARDLADGKLDAGHLAHKAQKEAEERALGLDTAAAGAAPLREVVLRGTKFFAPAGAPPLAAAEEPNNLCAYGEVCLYYNSGHRNANFKRKDTQSTIKDYAGYTFPVGLPGGGQPVKNNAAAVHNASGHYTFGVFYNSNHKGLRAWYAPGTGRDLPDWLKNNNASGRADRSW
ncbi:hypothetical protein C0216_16165 [Streptomyces globosus]|uniref:Peptidase inhibitor family I36 protein n=1 Tax=Streptomyces globosus TaxID=68209 RepID=A0A344U1K6_9ACTN|nr:hypothetical protein [Streptomyces globosus]AXE24777.1 hypothetical protein C0216_16165 [Streptomyces globosus]